MVTYFLNTMNLLHILKLAQNDLNRETLIMKKTRLLVALLVMLDLQTYGVYLFKTETFPWNVLGFLNTACFLSYAVFWGRRIFGGRRGICPEKLEERRRNVSLREEK